MTKKITLPKNRKTVFLFYGSSFILLVITMMVYLNRAGILIPYWKSAKLENIQHENGYAFIATTNHPELSSHNHPSPALILENGKPLPGPANSLHDDIRNKGMGRYSFWHEHIYFSTSDNTDPVVNSRRYKIYFPLMVNDVYAYSLYTISALALTYFAILVSYNIQRRASALGQANDEMVPTLSYFTRSTPMNNIWLSMFRIEIILAGFLLCVQAFFTRLNIPINLNWNVDSPSFPVLGISLFLVGIVLIAIPKINHFLRYNIISAYLIPMHIWCLFVLLGMELVLRVTVYSLPLLYRQTNWFGSIPAAGSMNLWGTEGYAITQYDGPTREIHTPFQGGDNIIFLGDSITEGLQVSDDQKYASVAEIILHRDGYNVDVHNLGHSGSSMADYVIWMNPFQSIYHPRIAVIELQQDDFIESFHESNVNYFMTLNSKIVNVSHQNDTTGNYRVMSNLYLGSPFFTFSIFGDQRIEQWKTQATVPNVSSISEAFDIDLAKQQMNLLIKASNGTKLILVLFPHAPYISGNQIIMTDPAQESLKEFLSNYYPQITLVDPLPEFQFLTSSGSLPMGFSNSTTPGWGHLNPQGNRILGELVAKAIEAAVK